MKKILLVCTGNTCRSSMASVLLKDLLAKKNIADKFIISSAGLAAQNGDKASSFAIQVMEEQGLDLHNHQATQLTPQAVEEVDLILTMTSGHKKIILQVMPKARGRVFTLKEFAGNSLEDLDVVDPFGQPKEVYQKCAQELKCLLERALEKL